MRLRVGALSAAVLLPLASGCASVTVPLGDRGGTATPAPVPAAAPVTPGSSEHDGHHDTPGHESGGMVGSVPQNHGNMVDIASKVPLNARTEARAKRFQAKVIATIRQKGWMHPGDLEKAGFVQMEYDEVHWYNKEYLTDGIVFDPARPEFLVVIEGLTVGVMFLQESLKVSGPETPAAPLMRWHYHRYLPGRICSTPILTEYRAHEAQCRRKRDFLVEHSPLMSHVWLYDAEDPFAAMLTIGKDDE